MFDDETRRGVALQSVLCGGCIVAGGFVKDSVLGRNVFVDAGAEVKESILFDNVYVGRGARIQRAIVDKNVRIAEGDHIGHDPTVLERQASREGRWSQVGCPFSPRPRRDDRTQRLESPVPPASKRR